MSNTSLVGQVHCEYLLYRPIWDMIDLLCMGERFVKLSDLNCNLGSYGVSTNVETTLSYEGYSHGRFILKPDPLNNSEENNARYHQLVARAVLFNATSKTVKAMAGEVFAKPTKIDLESTSVAYLEDDADGNGVSLDQQAQSTLTDVLKKGRIGILSEFPQVDRPTSQAEANNGSVRPSIIQYKAKDILDWKYERIGGITKTTMVKLVEFIDAEDTDEQGNQCLVKQCQFRYLILQDGRYYQQVEIAGTGEKTDLIPIMNAAGQQFDYIPFWAVGSENNTLDVDPAPVYDLANVNVGHYRNSADVEEAAWLVGQPMLFLTTNIGTEEFTKSNPGGVQFGSRAGINLGSEGSANLVQAEERSILTTLMDKKVEDMKALGAALITPNRAQTAEATRTQKASEVSVLSLAAGNISNAYQKAILACEQFATPSPNEDFTFELNRDFFVERMTQQDRQAWMADIQAGLATKSMYWDAMRKSDLIPDSLTDDEIEEGIDNQPPAFTGSEK